jgi:adenylate kinase family enzyme
MSELTVNERTRFPDVIFFYGPPASGKGTQSQLLQNELKQYNFKHIDAGSMLRSFIKLHLGDTKNENFEKQMEELEKSTDTKIIRALEMYNGMKKGVSLRPDLVWSVIDDVFKKTLDDGFKLIVDGIGRTVEDCKRFGIIAENNNLKVAIFHICVSEDDVIQRAVNRWYCPNIPSPFPGYILAKANCAIGEDPWQREEDTDVAKIRGRFKNQYLNLYAKALSTLQLSCKADLFIIDGRDSIKDDFDHIVVCLKSFYGFKKQS